MLRSCLLLLLLAAPASAEPLLYRLTDADTTIWLLGSVHALRAGDYPLDARIESAYANAERVVLEVDPAELDPLLLAGIAAQLGRFENGATLAEQFSPKEYARVQEGLAQLGLDAQMFDAFEPWFVGLQLVSLNLMRSGFMSAQGVDKHYGERALADGKQTAGLETAREQLGLFDSLPTEAQQAFLLDAVADSSDFREQMTTVVEAWRHGDAATLQKLADEELADAPAVREHLLIARNRRWVPQIEELLASTGDSLVIVGALHLVGTDGLVALLEKKGYEVEKVEE